jgi:hypothetical protein
LRKPRLLWELLVSSNSYLQRTEYTYFGANETRETDVWGGGSCSGPTGSPTAGYDCSGLVSWAVCAVTGRNLFAEGLRVTYSMYCASESTLKYA